MSRAEAIRHAVRAEDALRECRQHLCAAYQALPEQAPLSAALEARFQALYLDEAPSGERGNGKYFQLLDLFFQE